MGGNLFKLGRINRQQYLEIETELKLYLNRKFGDYYRIPRYYGNKPDFGDMDIIVSSELVNNNWQAVKKEICTELNIQQHQSTGAVFSTVYRNFQVDYFITPGEYFISTYNYLSFNDLGNFIGRICRRFNLKYGDRGLSYVYRRHDQHYYQDLPVSIDTQKIFSFLKLDYEQWSQGFDDLETMFQWLVNCPYFSAAPYVEQSKSTEKKVKQRPGFQQFLLYLEKNRISKTYSFHENRDHYLPMIHEFFPEADLMEQIQIQEQKESVAKKISAKFNGQLVMDLIPGLVGKELGLFIKNFRHSRNDFSKFILNSEQKDINQQIVDFYQIPRS